MLDLDAIFGYDDTTEVVEVSTNAEALGIAVEERGGSEQCIDAVRQLGWEPVEQVETEDWGDSAEEEGSAPEPCPQCGSLAVWWDMGGGTHCMTCERQGFRRSQRWAEKAARIRRRGNG